MRSKSGWLFLAFSLSAIAALAAVTLKSTGTTIKVLPAGSSGSISGSIDSSIPNRYNSVANAVYIYSGNVVPGDVGSSRSPMQVVLLNQNVCQFSYSSSSLAAGTYTIAFTNQANLDKPASTETLTFIGTKTVNVSGPTTSNFGPIGRILQVGANKTYKTIRAARDAVVAGDVIEIDAGSYPNQSVTWVKGGNCSSPINNVTVRGVGGRAVIPMSVNIPYSTCASDTENGKGAMLVYGSGMIFENIEVSGTTVTDENGAGFRLDGGSTVLCNVYSHDNQDGVLGGGGDLLIEYSEFSGNGFGDLGRNHNLYVSGNSFTLRYSYSHSSIIGHLVKSRALNNYILYNRLTDENGSGSYEVTFPDAGNAVIVGNMIHQGANSDNSIIIDYASESSKNPGRDIFVFNNIIVDDQSSGSIMSGGTVGNSRYYNNLYIGNKTSVGSTTKGNNVFTTATNFLVNKAGFDYHLSATATSAIDKGIDPSSVGYSNGILYEYVHPLNRKARAVNGVIDIGAFER